MGPPRADGSNTSHRHLHQCPWSLSILKNQSNFFPSARVSILALWLPPPSYFVSNTHHVAFPMASSRKRSAAAPATPCIAAVSSSPPPSEQPTVVGTPGLSDGDTGDARSLAVRAPNVADVLKYQLFEDLFPGK